MQKGTRQQVEGLRPSRSPAPAASRSPRPAHALPAHAHALPVRAHAPLAHARPGPVDSWQLIQTWPAKTGAHGCSRPAPAQCLQPEPCAAPAAAHSQPCEAPAAAQPRKCADPAAAQPQPCAAPAAAALRSACSRAAASTGAAPRAPRSSTLSSRRPANLRASGGTGRSGETASLPSGGREVWWSGGWWSGGGLVGGIKPNFRQRGREEARRW
jgi:hypothetical protein